MAEKVKAITFDFTKGGMSNMILLCLGTACHKYQTHYCGDCFRDEFIEEFIPRDNA
jgi:hypothetical protein